MNDLDFSATTLWTILSWEATQDPGGPQFPQDGCAVGDTLVVVPMADGRNLFWPNTDQMPCSVHLPIHPGSWATFAGINVPCETGTLSFDLNTGILTCKLTAESPGSTNNTGTFTAQASTDGNQTGDGS